MYEKIIEISEKLNRKFFFNYDISKLTWFRTGGKADLFCIVDNESELEIILNNLENIPYQIIGAGSNLLIRDKGYDVIGFTNAPHFNYKNTELIIHKKDTVNFTNEILNILSINHEFISYNYNENFIYEITVIIGKDYNILESFDEVSMYYEPF